MAWWLFLLPLACVTVWVWIEILRTWHGACMVDVLGARQARIDCQSATMPCVLCGNVTHTYDEHVRYPQSILAIWEKDPEIFLEGKWWHAQDS